MLQKITIVFSFYFFIIIILLKQICERRVSLGTNCLQGKNIICFVTALSPRKENICQEFLNWHHFSPNAVSLEYSSLEPARENGAHEFAHARSFCRCVISRLKHLFCLDSVFGFPVYKFISVAKKKQQRRLFFAFFVCFFIREIRTNTNRSRRKTKRMLLLLIRN